MLWTDYPRRGDSMVMETFLAPSADNQTRNYDTDCSNHHPLSINTKVYRIEPAVAR